MNEPNFDDFLTQHRAAVAKAKGDQGCEVEVLAEFIAEIRQRLARRQNEISMWQDRRDEAQRELPSYAMTGSNIRAQRVREYSQPLDNAISEAAQLQRLLVSKEEKLAELLLRQPD